MAHSTSEVIGTIAGLVGAMAALVAAIARAVSIWRG